LKILARQLSACRPVRLAPYAPAEADDLVALLVLAGPERGH
jgi:hypothetical protein